MPSSALEKRHTCQALCVDAYGHGLSISPLYDGIRSRLDHLDRMKCKRVSKVAVCSGNIRFDRVSHRIHTGVSNQFLRHSLCQFRVYDRNIWRDLKVSDRIFDALSHSR